MKTYTAEGTYGSQMTPCSVIVVESEGGRWYAVNGSRNANFTYDEVSDGVDVETLQDHDCFTSGWDINSEMDLFLNIIGEDLDELEG